MTAASPIVLEPAAQQVADAFSKPPFWYDMTPAGARKVLEGAQSGPVSKLPVDEEWSTVPAQVGDARVRIIRPQGATGTLPVVVYMRGGGWITSPRGAMQWFWDAYTTDPAQRAEITASPNQASTEQVTALPPTYLCVDEADVPGDEGEAYAAKLRSAGVPVTTVRYNGTIHDFMLLDAPSETRATRAAIDQATAFLRAGLGTI
jgi:acetyl esterase/lipase